MNQIKAFAKDFVANWKTPPSGRYVSYKEIAAYSVGGMGVQLIMTMFFQIAMAASCWLTGTVYGISPFNMVIIMNVATAVALVLQPLKSWMIDNLKTKSGKARPWLFWLGPPTALIVILVAFVPYKTWSPTAVAVVVGLAYVVLNFVANFYNGQYLQLSQLLSPNTNERTAIISVSSIVYSLGPTITGFVMPLIAGAFDNGFRNIAVYRISFPVFALLGLAMSYICYFGTKERVITSKRVKSNIKFSVALKKIIGNKYFWIINIGNSFNILRGACVTAINWVWVYMLQNDNLMSLLVTVMGTASLVGMVAGPFMCKYLGKKNTVLITNAMFLVSAIAMIFSTNIIWLMILLIYICNMAAAVQIITAPAMNAEALDYQQYKTGDRMEGFAGNFSIITNLIVIGLNFIIPAIQQSYGLINNYDILFDVEVRNNIIQGLAYVSIAGAILVSIPYFFWNLTEKRHREIIEVLKERAIEEDREDGVEETPDELEARVKGITLEELIAERERERISRGILNDNDAFTGIAAVTDGTMAEQLTETPDTAQNAAESVDVTPNAEADNEDKSEEVDGNEK